MILKPFQANYFFLAMRILFICIASLALFLGFRIGFHLYLWFLANPPAPFFIFTLGLCILGMALEIHHFFKSRQ